MIKKTVSYHDFNGNPQKEDLYFHAPKHVLLDHLDLKEKFERVSESLNGEKRELDRSEVNDVLQLVKRMIRISYGVRTDGGRKFRQSDDDWAAFESSAAYDSFLWAMFQNPNDAFAFMRGIMPDDLIQEAEAQAQLDNAGPKRPQDFQRKQSAKSEPTVSDNEEIPFDEDNLEEIDKAEDAIPAQVTGGRSIEELEAELARMRGEA